jgi:hypothetical protein
MIKVLTLLSEKVLNFVIRTSFMSWGSATMSTCLTRYSRSAKSLLGKCIYFWEVLVETNLTVYITAVPIEVKGQNEVPKVFFGVKPRLLDTPIDSTPSTYISLHSARRAEFIDTSLYSVTWPLNFDSVNIYQYLYILKKYSIPVECY